MEKRAWFGLSASMMLHAALLGMWWEQAAYAPAIASAPSANRVVEVRFLEGAGPSAPSLSPAAAETVALAASAPAEQASDTGNTIAQEAAPAMDSLPLFPLYEARYVPAGELDERPAPEAPVIIPFPDAPLHSVKVSGTLVLYIGADGRVDRVEADESDLPPAFERAAINTFLQARMRPGILNGQATRARMKVLVEFEQQ